MSNSALRNVRKKPKDKISEDALDIIRQHVKQFRRYKSHLISQEFVLCVDCVEDMYALYQQDCVQNNTVPEKIHVYRDMVLHKHFDIRFEIPLHEPCEVCSSEPGRADVNTHTPEVEDAYKEYQSDLKNTKHSDSDTLVITMDMLPSQPFPVIRETDDEFPRNTWQLLAHNFIMRSCGSTHAFICVWPQYIGSCGVDEAASCILRTLPFVLRDSKKTVKHLIVWTDSDIITKNFTMIFLWMYIIAQGSVETITHKFFQAGHKHKMETDKDYELITKKMGRMQCVYTHYDWIRVLQNSKIKGKSFKIIEMLGNDIVSMMPLNKRFTKRKTLANGKDSFDFSEVTAFEVRKEGNVALSTNYGSHSWERMNVLKRNAFPKLHLMVLGPKYPTGRKIKPLLYEDLMKVLPYIPKKDDYYFVRLNNEGRGAAEDDDKNLYIDAPCEE